MVNTSTQATTPTIQSGGGTANPASNASVASSTATSSPPAAAGSELAVGGTPPSGSGGQAQLAKDRIARFEPELRDPNLLDRMEFVLRKEGGDMGALILETACNRAMFSGRTLKTIFFERAYFKDAAKGDPNATRTAPHTKLTMDAIKRVIYGGENRTNLGTDQAYNDKNLFALKFIKQGATGSWFDLRNGKRITDPGRIQKLTNSPGSGMEEYIYRKDGVGDSRSTAGLNAKKYAAQYNVQPTDGPSTFTAGVPPTPDVAGAVASDLTGQPGLAIPDSQIPQTVGMVDDHGPTVVKNTNDSPKGMFTFPGLGAMVWVFFREGNPQFPVYFAASYSKEEWGGAYGGNSIDPLGTNQGSVGTQVSNSLKFTPNAGGGLEFTHIKDSGDPSGAGDKAVAMMYGDDGSNMMFSKGYHQIYTRHDRRDQIDGHLHKIVGGAQEEWVEKDYSVNVRGNVTIKIGKIDKEAMEAMKELSDFSNQMNKMLLENPGNSS
jgi:hypothetical protein